LSRVECVMRNLFKYEQWFLSVSISIIGLLVGFFSIFIIAAQYLAKYYSTPAVSCKDPYEYLPLIPAGLAYWYFYSRVLPGWKFGSEIKKAETLTWDILGVMLVSVFVQILIFKRLHIL
jgi:hypothetical protein